MGNTQTQTNIPVDQSRLRWVDVIRALGAFLVVLAHVQYSGSGPGVVGDFYYALTRVAVPLFFISSGYLLLSKNESLWDFFRKRAVKVFLPFLVWSVIYLVWQGEAFDRSFLEILKIYTLKIVRGPRESHLWFFYELFGLYLFTPILRVYLKSAERKDLLYFFGGWFLLVIIAKLVQEFTPLQIGFTYYFMGGYIGHFLFGRLVERYELTVVHKRIAWVIFFIALFATTAGMYLDNETQYFEDYFSLNVVIMSCASWVALNGLSVSDVAYRFVAPLSRASFGIYLAHVIVMTEFFSRPPFSILPGIGSNLYMVPVLGLLGFGLSFLLTFVLQKVPILKNIVP
jgi:surface polysaccharide O-acyltransferase-like enzyme